MQENSNDYKFCIKVALDNAKKRINLLDNFDKKSVLEEKYADIEDQNINEVMSYFKKIEKNIVRSQILND